MRTDRNSKGPRWWAIPLAIVAALSLAAWFLFTGTSRAQSGPLPGGPEVLTTAHATVGEAVRHFFFIRSEPVQPIAYTHRVHVQQVGLECTYCHDGVDKGPVAHIPNILTCMGCHEEEALDNPEVQKMTEMYERSEDIPWQRVYGWTDEAHVRFNHAPHIRAEVECATCHGDVAQMTVAQRVVDHTMGFCVDCHNQRGASNDCLVCHY